LESCTSSGAATKWSCPSRVVLVSGWSSCSVAALKCSCSSSAKLCSSSRRMWPMVEGQKATSCCSSPVCSASLIGSSCLQLARCSCKQERHRRRENGQRASERAARQKRGPIVWCFGQLGSVRRFVSRFVVTLLELFGRVVCFASKHSSCSPDEHWHLLLSAGDCLSARLATGFFLDLFGPFCAHFCQAKQAAER